MLTKKIIFIFVFLFGVVSVASSATIYVDGQISPSSCSTYTIATRACGSGSLTCYKTISTGYAALSAGDTLFVRGGTYNEKIGIITSGGSSDSLRKTISAYSTETPIVDGTAIDSSWGLIELNATYITINGLTIQNATGQAIRMYKGYITIQNCHIHDSGYGIMLDAYNSACDYVRVLNNTIHNTTGPGIYFYPTYSSGGRINYALIEGNTLYDLASTGGGNNDGVQVGGDAGGCDYLIFRNNTVYNHYGGGAGSTVDFGGHSTHWPNYYLLENNDIYQGTRSSPDMKFTVNYKGIMRRNRITNLPLYTYGPPSGTPLDTKIYHNTFITTGTLWAWDMGSGSYDFVSYFMKNNIYSSSAANLLVGSRIPLATQGAATGNVYWNGNYFHNTNASVSFSWGNPVSEAYGWGASTPKFTEWQSDFSVTVSNNTLDKASALTDIFVNPTVMDYNLKAGSGAIDKGVNLTTVTSTTGSGTTFRVADSHYFCDGWNLITGDTIRVGNNTRTITAIDYTLHDITVSSSVSWTQGDGVNIVYSGSAPDAGAHEYSEGMHPGKRQWLSPGINEGVRSPGLRNRDEEFLDRMIP